MASKNNINSVFTDIANSIRAKKGTTNTIQPINMAEEIDGIPTGITPSGKIEITNTEEINVTNYATAQIVDSNLLAENIKEGVSILGKVGTYKGGGDTSIEDGLITGEISGDYSNDRITKIRNYAFQNCKNLTSANLPQATSIGGSAFRDCSSITNISTPLVTSIGGSAFYNCSQLTSISLPLITSIGDYAFYNCSQLTSISLPLITSIGYSVFEHCSKLTSISLPLITSIGSSAFSNCSYLTDISLPQAKSIGNYAFSNCSSITNISTPLVTSIGSSAFSNCYPLMKLVIRQTDSVCTLYNTGVFESCYHFLGTKNSIYNPQGLKDGRIYVPDELVDSYKSATNWSAYADIIVPLSTLVE